jgi:hypothetical protein
MPTSPFYISISPPQVFLFKGFTTFLTASLVEPGIGISIGNPEWWSWNVEGGTGGIVALSTTTGNEVQVTGLKAGVVTLQASYTDPNDNTMITATVELTFEDPYLSYLSISPALVILEKNKGSGKMSPRFSTTIFKGFTTALTASIVGTGGAASGENPAWWSWKVTGGSGSVTLSKSSQQQPVITMTGQVVEVTGLTAGVVTLQASYSHTDPTTKNVVVLFTNTVELTVEETDLLIYAPDGFVYRVPHGVWANPNMQGVLPPDKQQQPVQVLTMDKLSESVQSLLIAQVPVANVPEPLPSPKPPGTTEVGEPSENITCFLLNLNSILLMPPPATPPQPPPPGKPKA